MKADRYGIAVISLEDLITKPGIYLSSREVKNFGIPLKRDGDCNRGSPLTGRSLRISDDLDDPTLAGVLPLWFS